jgi:hypothetical protein
MRWDYPQSDDREEKKSCCLSRSFTEPLVGFLAAQVYLAPDARRANTREPATTQDG